MNVALFLEIKNEYTEHLIDVLTPFIYEGLNSIYRKAVSTAEKTNCSEKTLLIFQKLLQSVQTWNQTQIEEETNRIKQASNTAEYLDDLVKAVIKSNIILLAYTNKISNIIGQTFYNNLSTSTFIHRCYTECAKDAHNNPYLFYHDISPMDLKRNQIIIQQNIQAAVPRAIRKILPISMILKEYLVNSINIINEPPEPVLVGLPTKPSIAVPGESNKTAEKILSEKKLEKEVMNLIKSDNNKSDKDKIKAIMDIDKILTNREPSKIAELSATDAEKSSKSMSLRKIPIAPSKKQSVNVTSHLIVDEVASSQEPLNKDLSRSDQKVININLNEQTEDKVSSKTVTSTSLSGNPIPKKIKIQPPELSEKIDPNNVNLIEVYGPNKK